MTAILRETNSASDKKRLMEVWEGERLEASGRHAACSTQRVSHSRFLSSAQAPRYARNLLSFKSALYTPFFPLGVVVEIHRQGGERARERRRRIPLRNFVFCPTTASATLGEIHRRSPKSDSVDTRSEGNISPTVQAVSIPNSATSNAANISFGQAQCVMMTLCS
jgi:hypothetical protein